MSSVPVFSVAGPHVVADDVDGEVIVLNLDTGVYYSFRDSASAIWQLLLQARVSIEDMVEHLCSRYEGEREAVLKAVLAFVKMVEAEGLIAASEVAAECSPAGETDLGSVQRTAFVLPVFEKYTDMEEFLLVDPIHEVDVSEWPAHRKRDSS